MSAESIRSFIQRAPWWAQPLIGLVLAAIVIVLSPLIILVAVGWCVWYGTFGEMPVDECIPYDDMRNDPEYQAFMNEVAATCDADDCPCDSCLAGGICDGPSLQAKSWHDSNAEEANLTNQLRKHGDFAGGISDQLAK